jgi:hypothetical protein
MGDQSSERLESQKRRNGEEYARNQLLGRRRLYLNEFTISLTLDHIDCFVSQSQGNESVEEVYLYPYVTSNGHDDDGWDKLGQAIGNFQALKMLSISGSIPDFEILVRILKYVRRKITLDLTFAPSSRVFSALGQNTGLRTLIVQGSCSMNESLCTEMRNGLGVNETLETLELKHVALCDDNADFWRTAFSFLRINKALMSLAVDIQRSPVSCLSAFRIDIAAMLQDNASLESISIQSKTKIEAEDYIAFITALQGNTTLKTLSLNYETRKLQLTNDEGKQMAALVKKTYAMESLPDIYLKKEARDLGAILRLNAAGRRYLIEDGSSISKGVEVLSRVNNGINCVFLHLLENPRLCDRSAVERVSAGESNVSSTNPTAGNGGEKRERAISVHEGKASHRRLA